MSVSVPVAADVPYLFDVIINSKGYVFLRAIDTSLPFRTQRASYARTPTFLERQNVSGSYSDNQQDFFLTASQSDWSGGEGQRFFRSTDAESVKSYFTGAGLNVDFPGRVFNRRATFGVTTAASIKASCGVGGTNDNIHAYADNTNLYVLNGIGTVVTSDGAHGAGGTVNQWGMCSDGKSVYIAGGTTIRRYDVAGATFNNFGAANANVGSLAYLNNTLYSCDGGVLKSYDTAGAATTLFTWKTADGTTASPPGAAKLVPFGGQLLIFFPFMTDCAELWVYDGTTRRLAELDSSILGFDCTVFEGSVFMSGQAYDTLPDLNGVQGSVPVVMYFSNGNIGELWRSPTGYSSGAPTQKNSGMPCLGSAHGSLIISSSPDQAFIAWHPGTGAFSKVGALVAVAASGYPQMSTTSASVFISWNKSAAVLGTFYPSTTDPASPVSITSSLFDFDNSLTKQLRSVKVDWSQTAGGTATVNIYYGADTNSPATLLQASAVSGTEYLVPAGVVGRAFAIKLDLVADVSKNVPTIKRLYCRAVPNLQSYRSCEYILDCSGVDGVNPVVLNDNDTPHPLDGVQQATNLNTAIAATTPFTVTDRFGSFTGVIEPGQSEIIEVSPEEYIARIRVREV